MSNDIERSLIEDAICGNINAFEGLVFRYESKIYNIAYRMFNNHEDANDMAQEALIKIYKNLSKFNFESQFSTWVYRVVVNTCLDEIRKRKNKKEVSMDKEIETAESKAMREFESAVKSPEEQAIENETIKEVRECIDELKPEFKSIIVLRDINGFSYTEIAGVLEIKEGTVKSRIARARENLKKIMEQKMNVKRQINRKEGDQ
ncbi:MAG: sigma-70 family RNA polymerase sigma factor [Clostridia bacterium]|jgi:RNA polymerase sigma-70 factor (ECF subfamily)|nr:sigma-70 family RNA polymerase sigma factor [Clostridia bacterium]